MAYLLHYSRVHGIADFILVTEIVEAVQEASDEWLFGYIARGSGI